MIFAEAGDERTVLLCLEEELRHVGLAGVFGEVARLSMTASRRLQLAAEASGVSAFVILRWRTIQEGHGEGKIGQTLQHVFTPPLRLPAWPSADRRSRLVRITRDLDRAALVASVRLLHDPPQCRRKRSSARSVLPTQVRLKRSGGAGHRRRMTAGATSGIPIPLHRGAQNRISTTNL